MATFLGRQILDIQIGSVNNQVARRALDFTRFVSGNFTQFYTIGFSVVPMWHSHPDHPNEIQEFFAKVAALELNPFDFEVPQGKLKDGEMGGNAATAAAGATDVKVSSSNIPEGRCISFTSHKKIYRVVTASSSSIEIYPPLREQVAGTINLEPIMDAALIAIPNIIYSNGQASPSVLLEEVL